MTHQHLTKGHLKAKIDGRQKIPQTRGQKTKIMMEVLSAIFEKVWLLTD